MVTPIQLAAAFTAIASRASRGSLRASITADGIRVEVADPAVMNDPVVAYDLRRDHSFSGIYAGQVRGVPVSVAMTTAVTMLSPRRAS